MVNRKILLSVTVIAMLTLSVGVVLADEVTSAINYQGRLADSSGSPLSGTYTMTFRLYEAATGGTALDTDMHDVVVTDGLFNKELNFDQSYFDGRALWLGVKVGTDSEMTPRQEFRPVPYALSLVPGARIMGAAQWNLNAETTHASGRALRGQASATSGTNYGVVGASRSPDGYGGYFYNDNGGVGVYGRGGEYGGYFEGNVRINQPEPTIVLHDTDGGGTKARIVFENTDRLVIQGEDDADESLGVYSTFSKNRDHDANIKVYGSATNTWGNYIGIAHDGTDGIIGTDVGDLLLNPAGNVGIGTTSPGAKLDVKGDTVKFQMADGGAHTWFPFVDGEVYITSDLDKSGNGDIYFRTFSDAKYYQDKMLIEGTTGNVGIGTTSPDAKLDVRGGMMVGGSDFMIGIHDGRAQGDKTQNRALVHWIDDSLVINFAGDFEGGVKVEGPSFSVSGTKNFLIDHPLDPEHKELVHSTLEGPEAGVFYRGEAQLSNGEATVMLPDYFEALTRKEDRTVLLTPKFEGDEQVSMLAASGVKDGKFRVRMIEGKNPSQKFYWEVKAVRADVEILEVEKTKPPAQ